MSKIFIVLHGDAVIVLARTTGNLLGELQHEVHAGESFLGHSYEELKALGQGEHDFNPKEEAA